MAVFTAQTALDIYRLFAGLATCSRTAECFEFKPLRVRDASGVLANQFRRKGSTGRDWRALRSWLALIAKSVGESDHRVGQSWHPHRWLESLPSQRPELHVLAPNGDTEIRADRTRMHVLAMPLPSHSVVRLTIAAPPLTRRHAAWPPACLGLREATRYKLYLTSPELTFYMLATSRAGTKLDLVDLVLDGYELCGHYWMRPKTLLDAEPYMPRPMRQPSYVMTDRIGTSAANLASYLALLREHATGLRGIRVAERAAKLVLDHAGSPMETRVAMLFCLPRALGGYGFPKPELNGLIKLSERAQALAQKNKMFADVLWCDRNGRRVVSVEYNSDSFHTIGVTRETVLADMHRGNAAGEMGVDELDLTYDQLKNAEVFDSFAASAFRRLVRSGVCHNQRPPSQGMLRQREVLRVQLLGQKSVSPAAAARVRRGNGRDGSR